MNWMASCTLKGCTEKTSYHRHCVVCEGIIPRPWNAEGLSTRHENSLTCGPDCARDRKTQLQKERRAEWAKLTGLPRRTAGDSTYAKDRAAKVPDRRYVADSAHAGTYGCPIHSKENIELGAGGGIPRCRLCSRRYRLWVSKLKRNREAKRLERPRARGRASRGRPSRSRARARRRA